MSRPVVTRDERPGCGSDWNVQINGVDVGFLSPCAVPQADSFTGAVRVSRNGKWAAYIYGQQDQPLVGNSKAQVLAMMVEKLKA